MSAMQWKETTTMRKRVALLALVLAGFTAYPGWAQSQDPHAGHRMSSPAAPATQDGDAAGKEGGMPGMNGASAMDMGSMQGGSAPPDARDPHAYSGGYSFGPDRLRLADEHGFGSLLMDRFEAVRSDGNTSVAYDLQAWYGRTYDRVVLKAEGEYDDGRFEEASTELLWGHAVATFWDTQLGVRHDGGEGPNRTWLAFGVQGLAPYWFELDATGYIGEGGRTALNLEAEYELLLTQKWILQPRIEADFHGKDDRERGIGSGLSEIAAGVRLRYEIRREFAPYLGVEWAGTFGDTKDLARAAGEDASETRLVAGLRFWF
jgi:copper resistance protein B